MKHMHDHHRRIFNLNRKDKFCVGGMYENF